MQLPDGGSENQLIEYFAANRVSWNQRTCVHRDSSFYDVAGFRAGKTSLNGIELAEVGAVGGKTLLHLQCHFGMDTLSWAREGARVTGVDFSDEAIRTANGLKEEIGVEARFIEANVYDLGNFPELADAFDIVFTSYGAIGWLPDLGEWARLIARALKRGGFFYIAEFHPMLWIYDERFEKITYPYFNREVIAEDSTGTYTDRNAPIAGKNYGWNHPISETINALIAAGLRIDFLHELPYTPYNCFQNLEQRADGMWTIKGLEEKLPMMFSLKATKV